MNARGILWLAGGTGLAFAIFGLLRPLLLDEFHTLYIATQGYAQTVEWLKPDAGVPMFHFLLTTWTNLFGTSEAAVHSLTSLLYLLTAAAVYGLGRAVGLETTGAALASLLYVISPQAFRHAHYGRPYALLALLVALSTIFFYRLFWHQERRPLWIALYVLVNICGTFTHYWFAFALLGQSVVGFLFWRRRPALLFSLLAASSLPFAVLWMPVILSQQMENGAMEWLQQPGPMALVNTFLGFFGQEWTGLPAYLVLAAAALWRWNAAAWQACRRNPALVGLAIIFTLILLTPFTISQLKPIYLPGRHTAAAFPIFAVLVATWLWEVVSAPARLWAVGILWVAAASGYSVYFLRPPLEDNRPAAQYLRNQMRSGDHVVFTGISRSGVQYYWDRMEAPSSLAASVFPSEMQLHRSWIDSKALMTNESPRMQREAEAIVQKLNQEIPAGRSAWVFRGYDPGLTSLLEQGLARQGFVLRDQVPFAGSHYTHLWRYERLP